MIPSHRSILLGARGLRLLFAAAAALALLPMWVSAQAQTVPDSRAQIALSFAPVVDRVTPSVVNIYSRRVVQDRAVPRLLDDPLFRHFFGAPHPMMRQRDRVENSLGSGVIVRPEGVILTNRHVIEGADEIKVVLHDRREFDATLLGTDERSDLAVLTIDTGGETLPALPLGDSDALAVGDLVLAIGNPFGVGQTVTMGIVSALARSNVGITDYRSFIQTDAAINPGNSGGALVDMAGRLVGINTAIYSKSGGSVGIGFAVPSVMARLVVDGLLEGGEVRRPWLGLDGQTVTAEIARSLGMERPTGVLISEVRPEGPAAEAGLRRGDVVVAYDGREIADEEGLRYRIGTSAVGGVATLRVLRNGRTREISVALRPPPETPPRNPTRLGGRHPLTGALVANLNPALAEELDLLHGQGAVVVLEIGRGSLAARYGLRANDVVRAVNGREPDGVAALDRLMRTTGPPWQMEIVRDGRLARVVIGG